MPSNIPRHNIEGYPDSTAYEAMSSIQREQDDADYRFNRLLKALKTFVDMSGYDLLSRISVRDRKTGKEYY